MKKSNFVNLKFKPLTSCAAISMLLLLAGMVIYGCQSNQEILGNDDTTTPLNRQIQFAGTVWNVRSGFGGPRANHWSDSEESVWVDEQGLHLKIRRIDNTWHSVEVATNHIAGYGEYRFLVEGPVDRMDKTLVLGLFVYAEDSVELDECVNDGSFKAHEIDLEFTKWGNENEANKGNYTVQPYCKRDNTDRFRLDLDENLLSTHYFNWQPDSIVFCSAQEHHRGELPQEDIIHHRVYKGNAIPDSQKRLNTRINFWLFDHEKSISDTTNLEIIITDVLQP